MNRFLNLFLAIAIIVLATSMVFAAGSKDGKILQGSEQFQREIIGTDADELTRPVGYNDNYVRPQSVSKVALAGNYNVGVGGDYPTLSHALAALQAEGVSAPTTFFLTDNAYTDTGLVIGGYPGQGPDNLVTIRPAHGVVTRVLFSGGRSGTMASLTFGFHFRDASGVVIDGFNGVANRSLTLEGDTVGVNTAGRNIFLLTRGSDNITVKNLVAKGNRRAASNGFGIISHDNLGFGSFGPQFNITFDNNHFWQGNAIAFIRGAGSGANPGMPVDYNITITNNLFGGEDRIHNHLHLATGINLQENANNVVIDNNDFYGIKVVGNPIPIAIRGGNSNIVVSNNKMHNIVTLSGAARPIIFLIGNITTAGTGIAPPTTAKIFNNLIYDIHSYGAGATRGMNGTTYNPTGPPNSANGTGSNIEWYHNTFYFDLAAGETGGVNAFLFDANFFGSNNDGFPDVTTIKNNIFATRRADGFTRTYLIFPPAVASSFNFTADNNLYYQTDAGAFAQFPTPWPMGASTVNNLFTDWQTITGQDANGKQGNPIFAGPNDGRIRNQPGDASAADMMGVALVPPITHDYEGQLRADHTPVDVGADAFISYPWEYDALPLSILGPPLEGIKVGTNGFPKVKVRNNGSFELDIPINVTINSDPVYNSSVTVEDVPPFSEVEVTFTEPFNTSTPGEYTISVTTSLANDQNPANNGPITRTLLVVPTVSIPATGYVNNFDASGKSNGLVQGGWTSAATAAGPNDWVLGTPAKTIINSAFSAPNSWVTGPLNANYALSWQGAVYSPYFSFENLTNPVIKFALAFLLEKDYDSGIFEYTIDNGATWVRADRDNAINWYNRRDNPYQGLFFGLPCWNDRYENNPGAWRTAVITLPSLAGVPSVRFRLHFGSDPGVVDEGIAFDNFEIMNGAILAGMKFLDVDRAGDKDAGEPGVAGWNINLAPYNYVAVTDANGNYQFTDNIIPGAYTVYEDDRAGWVQTYPTTVPPTYELTVTDGSIYGNLDFGNYFNNASISGMKFEDLNGNGIKDAGEPGLAGWTINLAGPTTASAVTGVGGTYTFANLLPGDYTVSEVLQAGWVKTFPTAASYSVTLDQGGQAVVDKDFGNFKLAAISGRVFNDFDRDGVYDLGEPGIDEVVVNLNGVTNNYTTTTPASGLYSFAAAKDVYTLAIVTPAGKYIIAPASGNYPVTVDASGLIVERNFALSSTADNTKYRSFRHEDIVTLVNGKLPKATKKKNIGGYWTFVLTNNTDAPATELHIQFKNDVNSTRPMTHAPFTAVAGDGKKKFDFTGGTVAVGASITISGYSAKGKPQQIKKFYWGSDPKKNFAVNILPTTEYLELPAPTYANLINEVYSSGGFAADGGLLVGTVGDPKTTGWVLIAKPGDVQKSLIDKTGIHTGDPGFFVNLGTKLFLKGQKSLPPAKHNNKLFAEIVALKLGIAASFTGHTQPGFGELIYQGSVVAHHGKMVKTLANEASAAMTSKVGNALAYYTAIREINTAFASSSFDSAFFAVKTVLTGVNFLKDVTVLRAGTGAIAVNLSNENKYTEVPDIFELAQNYPNPFNPSTTIQFILPEDAIVTLKVYNVLGQEVATLANRELFTEGSNDVEFDAGNLSSGVYFYHITAEGIGENAAKFSQIKKMVLMK